ncbi:hypothetical protein RHSIM_Rhsim03G0127000 [Rhododendron simsii]|uniref:Uncharacterized protein n=1 Tax=Rhododendron simsii TaxID=118357 RepID=A0A834H7Y2_RHOSS|nr:hypothetical protein RHSIM_Rhsim03G0127000 [Rhododendron simsii]
MVLSNKKLKQKLRDSVAESLTASEGAQKDRNKSQPQHSLTSLLGSATRKPRLSKREKRRKTPSLGEKRSETTPSSQGLEVVQRVVEIGDDSEKENGNKKKKKKRKIDEAGLESGGSESVENVVAKKSKKKKLEREEAGLESGRSGLVESGVAKKSKKKKNKKKKKKKKDENEGVKEGEKSANGVSELGGMESIMASDGQEITEVATKVYVGGIPYYSTEDDIRSYFESCGTITEVDCMKFPESGKFRGIAIINFKTEAAAKRALDYDGSDMGGLFLKIQPYKSTKPKKASNFAPAIMKGYNRIYVGNLSWEITEDELRKLFLGCNISAIRFGKDKETGEFRGYAHVDFVDSLSLNMALNLDQNIVCGRPVGIRCAVPKKATESKSRSMPLSKEADTNSKSMPPPKEADTEEPEPKEAENPGMATVSGKIRRRTCYECGEKGHLSTSCPKKQPADLTNSSAT